MEKINTVDVPDRLGREEPSAPSVAERLADILIGCRPLVGLAGIFLIGAFITLSFWYAFGTAQGKAHAKDNLDVVHSVLEAAVIASALVWFFITAQTNQRVSFDVECVFFRPRPQLLIAEVSFLFENKGLVEVFIRNLECTIHSLDQQTPQIYDDDEEFVFAKRISPTVREGGKKRLDLMPRSFKYFYVRPGVRQVITRTVWMPPGTEIIRITSGFSYSALPGNIHTAQRVFAVPKE